MNRHALFHKPQSEWAFPVSRNECVLRLRSAKGDLSGVDVVLNHKYDGKHIGKYGMKKRFSDTLFDYYEIAVPTDLGRRVYYFELKGMDGETALFTELGASSRGDIPDGFFPHFQIPFTSESDVMTVPDKFKSAVIYQIFPDRFAAKNPKIADWNRYPNVNDFFGGELYAAAEKLEYLKDLGVTAVYLTPIHPSHTNHHYDVEDYYTVSSDFGGEDALKTFIDSAHRLGISVILDGVFNHCSALNPMFRDVAEKGRASRYYDFFMIDGDYPDFNKCNYQTFARRVAYMPKLNGDNPEVVSFVCDVTTYWIKKFGVDAWRLDVADDMPPAMWREVRKAVKAADKNAIMIGEDWMDPEAFLRGDVFDGVMNYGFSRAVRDYLAYMKADAEGAAERLIRTYLRTTAPAADMMMNIVGCHDTPRIYSMCDENMFRYKSAMCMLFFYDGMPTVFYGDEIPLSGLADPDCRRGFDWSRTGSEASALIKTLSAMRRGERKGTRMDIKSSDGALVMKRGENRLIINNTDAASKTDYGCVPARSTVVFADGKEITFGDR